MQSDRYAVSNNERCVAHLSTHVSSLKLHACRLSQLLPCFWHESLSPNLNYPLVGVFY